MQATGIFIQSSTASAIFYEVLNHYQTSYTKKIVDEALILLGNLWPYLVLGIITTSLIKMLLSKDQVSGFFRDKKNFSIILAALIGVVSPLGSYIVIPLSAALFLIGTPLPPLMALLVSSPLINPNLFLLTAGAFGYETAIARVVSAFVLGLLAGYGTLWLVKIRVVDTESIINKENHQTMILANQKTGKPFIYKFGIETYKMTKYISKYFFLAILIAAGIKILTPPQLLMGLVGKNMFLSVVVSTAAGVPFYVCGGAAIPVVQQLADLGMGKGAVLAFFISGPVTKISNLVLMQSAFSARIFALYLVAGISGALVLGLLYSFF